MESFAQSLIIVFALVLAVASLVSLDVLLARRLGRVLLVLGIVLFPVAASLIGVTAGVSRSSKTEFCVSCHEMEPYGRSLFVDNPDALSASHYQYRRIGRSDTCYGCHTDYAMYGDIKAKLNGLIHVWVHYVGPIPDKIELYQPYPNYNCQHCHEDARAYVEVPEHQEEAEAIKSGAKSCLECHEVGHDLEGVKHGKVWVPGS